MKGNSGERRGREMTKLTNMECDSKGMQKDEIVGDASKRAMVGSGTILEVANDGRVQRLGAVHPELMLSTG